MAIAQSHKTGAPLREKARKPGTGLALTLAAAQLANLLYVLSDRIYLGHMAGTGRAALTGAGLGIPFIMLLPAFAWLVGMGAAPRAAALRDGGDPAGAERLLGSSLTLLLIVSAILTPLFQVSYGELVSAFGVSGESAAYAGEYLRVFSLGTVFILITSGLSPFIAAQGGAGFLLKAALIGTASNLILDPVFIFALKLGVRGAALSNVLSQALAAAYILASLTGKKRTVRLRFENLRLKFGLMLPCLGAGLVPFLLQAAEGASLLCFNAGLSAYGGEPAVGTMAVLAGLTQLFSLPLAGLAQAALPALRRDFAAGEAAKLKRTFSRLLAAALLYSVALWAAVSLWPQLFARLFSPDQKLAETAAPVIRLFFSVSCLTGLRYACLSGLAAVSEKPRGVFTGAVTGRGLLLLPLICLLPALPLQVSGAAAVYLSGPAAELLLAALTLARFSPRFGRALRLCAGEADPHAQSGLFRFLRKAILIFTGPMETVWEEPFSGRPAIFVCNHDRAYGPIAMNVHFELAGDLRSWINAQVLSVKEAPAYIREDYWWDTGKWYSPILGHTLVWFYTLIIPPILRGADCIPVYHDTGVISTLRNSVKMLADGKQLLLFPEQPTGYHKYAEKIFDGFVSVGRLYYARERASVSFYPTYVDWKKRQIRVGKPLIYDPAVKYEAQTAAICAGIEAFLARCGQ
ncbi:MAG: polysaccharide biosynthesis C-terminal domain-containing protein [Oscillospiraceae bacterium]|jgi:Na+-driven multidrug efflux pump|nr:polysaccharide biosynthesis C-terminal domain-containing protein [Oscillospiraceae bacterium]